MALRRHICSGHQIDQRGTSIKKRALTLAPSTRMFMFFSCADRMKDTASTANPASFGRYSLKRAISSSTSYLVW